MLIEFYGTGCPHCKKMDPLIERLEKERGVRIERYEVWHNKENAAKMDQHDRGRCGGVPFFVNTESDATICGEAPYEALERWANGEKVL
jgi:thiol-disulfide isomerase/thioredoxin